MSNWHIIINLPYWFVILPVMRDNTSMEFYTGSCDFAAHHASHKGTFHTQGVCSSQDTQAVTMIMNNNSLISMLTNFYRN